MRRFVTILALLFICSVANAQRGLLPIIPQKAVPSPVGSLLENTALENIIARQLAREIAHPSTFTMLARQDREQYLKYIGVLPLQNMATLSEGPATFPDLKDKIFAFKNDKNAFPWLALTEKDLLFLSTHKDEIRRSVRVLYPEGEINYASFIPEKVHNIAVGEEHNVLEIRQAFEQLVFQYQKQYPERKLIVLTEFVSDRLLAWEDTGNPVRLFSLKHRIINDDFLFFSKFIRQGIEVIGLEDVVYFNNHQTLIAPSFRQVDSVYGMKQRNEHWRSIIEEVRRREPDAIFFIYTGNMHVHYRAPFTLTNPSTQTFVFQFVRHDLGDDLPFGFVMKDEPFFKAEQGPAILTWPKHSPYRARSGFDVSVIFPGKNQ